MHNMHVFLTEIKWERLKVIQDPTDSDPLLLFYRETPYCKSMLNYRSRSAFNLKICLFYHVYFYISNIIMRRISLLTNTLRIAILLLLCSDIYVYILNLDFNTSSFFWRFKILDNNIISEWCILFSIFQLWFALDE